MLYRVALGQAIREIRQENFKTLRDVARDVPMALGYLSEVERGQKEASSEMLEGIAHSFGMTVSALVSYANDILILSEINELKVLASR